jgi:hypothetical protein
MKRLCLLLAMTLAPAAMAAYKCVDEKGATLIGDTPPEGCSGVVIYEISRSGNVIRKIDPSPTPEQVKAYKDDSERRREAERVANEQKRKDTALLMTYAAEREFDMTRDRNMEPIKARIKITQERIVGVDKRVKDLEEEMEFYKAGKSKAGKLREIPSNLVHDLERAKTERVTLEKSIGGYEKEIEAVRQKYDNDKKRWVILRSATDSQPAKGAADSQPAKGAAR